MLHRSRPSVDTTVQVAASIKTLSRHHCPGCCIDQDPQSTPLSRLLHRSRPSVDTTVQVAASIKTLSRHHCPGCCIDQDLQSTPLSRLLHRSRPSVDTTVQVAASIKTLSRHHCPGCCIDQDPQSTPLSRLLHRSRPSVDTTVQVATSIKTLSRHHCPGCCVIRLFPIMLNHICCKGLELGQLDKSSSFYSDYILNDSTNNDRTLLIRLPRAFFAMSEALHHLDCFTRCKRKLSACRSRLHQQFAILMVCLLDLT